MNKQLFWIVAVIFTVAQHVAAEERFNTRQVIQGDLLYRSQALAQTEVRAVFLAQARAAWMLSVECGAPPRETRIYNQTVERLPDGSFSANVEQGTTIEDCEAVRRASSETRERLAHPGLLKAVSYYESLAMELQKRPVTPQDSITAKSPSTFQDLNSIPVVLWTDEQELSNLRSLKRRTSERLKEREQLALSH